MTKSEDASDTASNEHPPTPPKGISYYELLGVDEDATEHEIKQAYRNLAQKYHPDKSNHPDAEEVFSRIKEAYEVLTSPQRRETYDQMPHEEYVNTVKGNSVEKTRGQKRRKRPYNTDSDEKRGEKTNTESSEKQGGNTETQVEESASFTEQITNTGHAVIEYGKAPFKAIENRLSDDVVSKAVRKTWGIRLTLSVITFVLLIGVGELVGTGIFPTLESLSSNAFTGYLALSAILTVITLLDGIRTERSATRGGINVDTQQSKWGPTLSVASVLSLIVWCFGYRNGGDPGEAAVQLITTGTLSQNVWGAGINVPTIGTAIVLFLTTALLFSGVLVGIPFLIRRTWYDRYVRGYATPPVIWELVIIQPLLAAVWTLATPLKTFPLPDMVNRLLTVLVGDAGATTLGYANGATDATMFLVLVSAPAVLGVVFYTTHALENAIRNHVSN